LLGWLKRRRRRKLAVRPLPAEWTGWLDEHLPSWRQLSDEEQARFLELLKIFVWEKRFVGAGGLELTDEMKVVVGACAVRLVLHLDLDLYDRLTELVLYPYEELRDPSTGQAFLGSAHSHGAVVLSWPAVLQGLRDPHDGLDTATHELAHALDLSDGVFDGVPLLRSSEHYRPWAQVLGKCFQQLQARSSPVLRDYGASAPEEFFAVATEVYFERPAALRREAPDLYEELHRFYGWDPPAEPARRRKRHGPGKRKRKRRRKR